jgi:hypothetical protein
MIGTRGASNGGIAVIFNPIRNARRSSRRGAAAVEMAFICPVLFIVVFGIIEFGRGWMLVHVMTEAARRGARAACSMNSTVAGSTTNWADYLDNNVVKPCLQSNRGYASSTSIVWKVNGSTADPSTANGANGSASGYVPGDKITCHISAPIKDMTWMPLNGALSSAGWKVGHLASATINVEYSLPKE